MLAAQSAVSDNKVRQPKSGRKALQPKNPPAIALLTTNLKSKLSSKWIEIALIDDSNKENVPPIHATPEKTDVLSSVKIESFDPSLAEELSAIRQKLDRLRRDKEKTEKMLEERNLKLDMQMKELLDRGEVQKQLELEVDRLFRLKELRLSCMSISPIRTLREKEREKRVKEDHLKDLSNEDRNALRYPSSLASPNPSLECEERQDSNSKELKILSQLEHPTRSSERGAKM